MPRPRERSTLLAFPERLDAIARDKGIDRDRIEVWFGDEARIGQKNKITRRWARRGTRPSAPHDQRTASTYIFGAICPGDGKGAALVLPACNTEAMNLHLAEIAAEVAPGKHAVLVVDQAGWHLSAGLVLPDNITLVVLPPKCPELNPAENVWQFMRDNWLSNRVFASYTDLVDPCCQTTSRSWCSRPNARSSTPPRTSGSSCAITGSRTGCSHPTPTLSTIAARPGTSSSSGPGRSCQSAYATGPMGSDQRKLV